MAKYSQMCGSGSNGDGRVELLELGRQAQFDLVVRKRRMDVDNVEGSALRGRPFPQYSQRLLFLGRRKGDTVVLEDAGFMPCNLW